MRKTQVGTTLAKTGHVTRQWHHLDLTDQTLGRVAVKIATVLMGKHKPTYTPHVDCGDFVIVTNAHKVRLTGKKAETMEYPRYSYYPGGRKADSYRKVMEKFPERIITTAVRRMLPKSALGKNMLSKLKVYASDTHPHGAQQPVPWAF